jgi:hypothetical protein
MFCRSSAIVHDRAHIILFAQPITPSTGGTALGQWLFGKGQELFALLFAAMDLEFSRQRYSGAALFEFDISAFIIIPPRLEHLP